MAAIGVSIIDQEFLHEITRALYGGDYCVGMEVYEVPLAPDSTAAALIDTIWGLEATSDTVHEVDGASVWNEIERKLLYEGDYSHGPYAETLQSDEFQAMLRTLKQQIHDLLFKTAMVESFAFKKEPRSLYCVYWAFNFIFRVNSTAIILCGSSSD